ncbi:MAG: HypC/HybG/HupF family hydrogenase formation chaperone [Gemmatimonadaceae bacterium]|jgi:hydrogenase expression/formation protein HypC|nr:HypC/HybG/HupF family hydrogenase formation chaperone [Gemmatimonadaceae bacterium]
MCLAIPGKIVSIADAALGRVARVSFGGVIKEASLAMLPHAEVGQYVLVHVGVALSVVDEKEAEQVFRYLAEAGELEELHETTPSTEGASA